MNNLKKYQWCNAISLVNFEFEVKKSEKEMDNFKSVWVLNLVFKINFRQVPLYLKC